MTLYLVRHGSAGRRDGSDPHDGDRHLDNKGLRQAAAVADHLGVQPIELVLSSPLPRCLETVMPLAETLGIRLAVEVRLAEGTDVSDAWELIEELGTSNAVLCSHGDVIPDLVRRNEARGMRLSGTTGFAKGSVWALEGWDGTRFAKGSWDKLR